MNHYVKIKELYNANPEKFLIGKTIQLINDRQTAVNADFVYNSLLDIDINACRQLLASFNFTDNHIADISHNVGANISENITIVYADYKENKIPALVGLFAFIVNYDNDIFFRFEDLNILKDFLINIAANENYYDNLLDTAYIYKYGNIFAFFDKEVDIINFHLWKKALLLQMPKNTAISIAADKPQLFDCVATNYKTIAKIIKFIE